MLVLLVFGAGGQLHAQTLSPEQALAAMDKCREQVVSQLSFSDKMKMRGAMSAIQGNKQFIDANNMVINALTPEEKVKARKELVRVKLDLLEKQDPSLKPVVQKIRSAQAALLK
jgi:hypothetical protein